MEELLARLAALRERLDALLIRLDLRGKQAQIADLEAQTAESALWDDPQRATALLQRLTALKNKTARWEALSRRLDDARELLELALAEGDDQSDLIEDVGAQVH